jgi:hypothetical protein
MQDMFVPSLIAIGMQVLEKIFFFNINISEYGFPYCGPFLPPGDHGFKKFESTL